MAGATSRISGVLVTGPLAPFAEDYRRELRKRGYTERPGRSTSYGRRPGSAAGSRRAS